MAKIPPKALEFLETGRHFAKIATVGKDGSPHLSPIWYMCVDGKLIVNTTRQRVKFRNIMRDPRVSFLVDEGYPYVIIEGRARVATERDPMKDIEALAIRYDGKKKGMKAARERFWKMDRVTLEIVPEKVIVDL